MKQIYEIWTKNPNFFEVTVKSVILSIIAGYFTYIPLLLPPLEYNNSTITFIERIIQ